MDGLTRLISLVLWIAACTCAAVFLRLRPVRAQASESEVQPHTWKNEVVYQIYPRSFADGNGDGIGDLRGILQRVDYLKSLGVDAIWLCPVNRTTNYDNGYDVTDYLDIDPTFGTMEDWNALRDALHERGIKIIMDLVLNHTSDAHPWFIQEVRYRTLLRQLSAPPPHAFPHGYDAWREAVLHLLTPSDTRLALVAEEPFASFARSIENFKQAAAPAAALGYPTAEQQIERMRFSLFGSPAEQEEARAGHNDFYYWRDMPNNWTAIFSGPVWHFVADTNVYYLALFSRHQPDLNWNNPRVRTAMVNTVDTWVKRGVDGFRLDSVGFLAKDLRFLDAPPDDTARMGRGMRYFVNQPQVHAFLRELNERALARKPIRTVGEVSFSPVESALLYAGLDRHELTEVFLFDHMYVDIGKDKWDVRKFRLPVLKRILGHQQTVLHGKAWLANYLENHDQLRAVSRFGDDKRYRVESAKMLGTLLFTLEGTPYIYQGQEIGMTNGHFAHIEEVDDIEARNYYTTAVQAGDPTERVMQQVSARNRDNVRTLMQWDDTANAGFSQHAPWIRVNANYKTVNVKNAEQDDQSVLAYYKQLISLRKKHQPWVTGSYEDLLPDHPYLYVFTRTDGGRKAVVFLNFSDTQQMLPRPLDKYVDPRAEVVLTNYSKASKTPRTLRPFEARVYADYHD